MPNNSSSHYQPITIDSEMEYSTTLRNLKGMLQQRSEMGRLAALSRYKGNWSVPFTRGTLAKYGFTYVEQEDRLKCCDCDIHINPPAPDFDPKIDHQRLNPQCPFVLSNSQLFSNGNAEQTSSQPSVLESTMAAHIVDDFAVTDSVSSAEEVKFFQRKSSETIDELRLSTFSNWPLITPSGKQMATAGFYYTNIADRVLCLHCHIMLHKWNDSDQPYEIHRLKSPTCPFVQSFQDNQTQSASDPPQINGQPATQVLFNPIHTQFADIAKRIESFKTWPHTEVKPLPPPMVLTNAGFFYTGEQATVRCFYCNGALRNWQANDDPKVEHARWFPHCAYIRQMIGENLYEAIQRKNRQLLAEKNGYGPATNVWSEEERDRMVKARLDLPAVAQLREEGYDLAMIRKVIDMQLKFKKDDFKSTDDLCIAYFVLGQQVKVIKGNEANLLIPSVCSKNRQENPNGEVLTPSLSPLNIQESPASGRSSPSSSSNPRVKDNGETRDCVVCMETECQVACMPCGHFSTCVPCGHSLRSCPICRAAVKSLVRIYQ